MMIDEQRGPLPAWLNRLQSDYYGDVDIETYMRQAVRLLYAHFWAQVAIGAGLQFLLRLAPSELRTPSGVIAWVESVTL